MRAGPWFLAMALAAAVSATGLSQPGSAEAAGCPSTPLTVGELRGLWDGEFAGFAGMTSPRGRGCYGAADVRVIGYVDTPDGLGGTNASGIVPAWLTEWGLLLYGSSNAIRLGLANDVYVIAIPPKLGDLNKRYAHRWVMVTAHFDDPRARTCHGWGVDKPTRKESVRVCRSILVLSSVSLTSAPDTSTAGAAVSATTGGTPLALILALAWAIGGLTWARRFGRERQPARRPPTS